MGGEIFTLLALATVVNTIDYSRLLVTVLRRPAPAAPA